MSAKLLFTFKHFKFALLPLLTHSALGDICNSCDVFFFMLMWYTTEDKISKDDEERYWLKKCI